MVKNGDGSICLQMVRGKNEEILFDDLGEFHIGGLHPRIQGRQSSRENLSR
jgi:hypothetical protein